MFVSGSGREAGCFVVGGHGVSGCELGMGWAGCVAVCCLYPLSGWEGRLDGVDGSGGGEDGRMGCGWLDDWGGGCAKSGSGWCWRPGSRIEGPGSGMGQGWGWETVGGEAGSVTMSGSGQGQGCLGCGVEGGRAGVRVGGGVGCCGWGGGGWVGSDAVGGGWSGYGVGGGSVEGGR